MQAANNFTTDTAGADSLGRSGKGCLLVHVDWCGYCKEFVPVFTAAAQQNTSGVPMLMINPETHALPPYMVPHVQGYPTVFIFKKDANGNAVSELYQGERSHPEQILQEVQKLSTV